MKNSSMTMAVRRERSHDEIRRKTIAHMLAGTTDLAQGPKAIDPAIYRDPARAEAERQELFLKRPILVGLSLDVPNPGDKLIFDLLGPPMLIVRNKQGELGAFLNMCPHRAARLVHVCDSRARMTCNFHGWTFGLDGELIGLPGKEGFEGIERERMSLVRLPVAERHGMIFVTATPGSDPIDADAWLGPMGDELAHLELGKARPIKSSVVRIAANWKYAYDTYGESYHFATVHPTTVATLAHSNTMAHFPMGKHVRVGFPRADFGAYGELPEHAWPKTDYGGLYMLFPNVSINVNALPGGGMYYGVSRIFPGSTPGESVTLMTTYRPDHMSGERPDKDWADMHDFIERVVTDEDYSIAIAGQKNLQWAPEDFRMVFGANEAVLQKQHGEIAAILEKGSDVAR